jgi:hypothetical protein
MFIINLIKNKKYMNMMEKPNIKPQGDGTGIIFMEGGGKIIVDGKVGSAVEEAIHGGENPVLKGEETYKVLEGGKITVKMNKPETKAPTE